MNKNKTENKLNVLFFICDDLNNALGNMGRVPFAPAPNVERIAKKGVAFTNSQSNCPVCLAARNGLYSGLYPHTTGQMTIWDHSDSVTPIAATGIYSMKNWGKHLLRDCVMMPKHFKDYGYTVLGGGKTMHAGKTDETWWTEYAYGPDYGPWPAGKKTTNKQKLMYEGEPLSSYVKRYRGLDRFFLDDDKFKHHIETAFGPLEEICDVGKMVYHDGSPFHFNSDQDRSLLPDEKVTEWGIEQLGKKHDKPFFLNLGYMKPHTPLNVPQKYFDRIPLDRIELPPLLQNDLDDCARAMVEHKPYGFLLYKLVTKGGADMWKKWLQAYLACISFVDDQVGKVLDALDNSPYRDNTIIIFTSDNGYHMGEKEYIFKETLWEEAAQVPLIISVPGVCKNNSTCKKAVSLIDIYPTLVDLCDLPEHPNQSTHGFDLQGHSLRPFLEDPEKGKWKGPEVALSSVRGDTGIHHSVRSESIRYILCNNGEEELYDHGIDPHEWTNLADREDYGKIKAQMRQQLMDLVYGINE